MPDFKQNPPDHKVLVVTLKDGKTYALDLAGGQYRQYHALVPWNVYSKRILEVKKREKFGYEATQDPLAFALLMNGAHSSNGSDVRYDTRIYIVRAGVARGIMTVVEGWEAKTRKTTTQMLRTKENIFQADVKALFADIESIKAPFNKMWKDDDGSQFQRLHRSALEKTVRDAKQRQNTVQAVSSKTTSAKYDHPQNSEKKEDKDAYDWMDDPIGPHLIAHGASIDIWSS